MASSEPHGLLTCFYLVDPFPLNRKKDKMLYYCCLNFVMVAPQAPLAERLRPQTLDQLVGQQHLTGKGSVLRTAIEHGKPPSMILWGPPGTGKTTIAGIIANSLHVPFYTLSAISAGVKEVREVIAEAREKEKGIVTLIGATTENPSFEVNSALLSRCQVYVLRSLTEEDLIRLLHNAFRDDEWLRDSGIALKETAALIRISGGDARKLLNLLEVVCDAAGKGAVITDETVMEIAQQRVALYDKKGEQHYDIISAFIKCIRGSDPNAAVYWLARMIEGGEDVKFIARRLLILASEDIGNANPNALLLANACFDAVTKIGWPESNLILSQCATYLASSPKSNSATIAIGAAQAAVRTHGDLPVPLHIRHAPTKLMKNMDYGQGYQYSHSYENNFSLQEYLR